MTFSVERIHLLKKEIEAMGQEMMTVDYPMVVPDKEIIVLTLVRRAVDKVRIILT